MDRKTGILSGAVFAALILIVSVSLAYITLTSRGKATVKRPPMSLIKRSKTSSSKRSQTWNGETSDSDYLENSEDDDSIPDTVSGGRKVKRSSIASSIGHIKLDVQDSSELLLANIEYICDETTVHKQEISELVDKLKISTEKATYDEIVQDLIFEQKRYRDSLSEYQTKIKKYQIANVENANLGIFLTSLLHSIDNFQRDSLFFLNEKVENSDTIENSDTMKKSDTIENIDMIENIDTIENGDTMKKSDTIENIDMIENIDTIENSDTMENNRKSLEIAISDYTKQLDSLLLRTESHNVLDLMSAVKDYDEKTMLKIKASIDETAELAFALETKLNETDETVSKIVERANAKLNDTDESMTKIVERTNNALELELNGVNEKLNEKIQKFSNELDAKMLISATEAQSKIDDKIRTSAKELEDKIKLSDGRISSKTEDAKKYIDVKINNVDLKIKDVHTRLDEKLAETKGSLSADLKEADFQIKTSLKEADARIKGTIDLADRQLNSKIKKAELDLDAKIINSKDEIDLKVRELDAKIKDSKAEFEGKARNFDIKIKDSKAEFDDKIRNFDTKVKDSKADFDEKVRNLDIKIKDSKAEFEEKTKHSNEELDERTKQSKAEIDERTKHAKRDLESKIKLSKEEVDEKINASSNEFYLGVVKSKNELDNKFRESIETATKIYNESANVVQEKVRDAMMNVESAKTLIINGISRKKREALDSISKKQNELEYLVSTSKAELDQKKTGIIFELNTAIDDVKASSIEKLKKYSGLVKTEIDKEKENIDITIRKAEEKFDTTIRKAEEKIGTTVNKVEEIEKYASSAKGYFDDTKAEMVTANDKFEMIRNQVETLKNETIEASNYVREKVDPLSNMIAVSELRMNRIKKEMVNTRVNANNEITGHLIEIANNVGICSTLKNETQAYQNLIHEDKQIVTKARDLATSSAEIAKSIKDDVFETKQEMVALAAEVSAAKSEVVNDTSEVRTAKVLVDKARNDVLAATSKVVVSKGEIETFEREINKIYKEVSEAKMAAMNAKDEALLVQGAAVEVHNKLKLDERTIESNRTKAESAANTVLRAIDDLRNLIKDSDQKVSKGLNALLTSITNEEKNAILDNKQEVESYKAIAEAAKDSAISIKTSMQNMFDNTKAINDQIVSIKDNLDVAVKESISSKEEITAKSALSRVAFEKIIGFANAIENIRTSVETDQNIIERLLREIRNDHNNTVLKAANAKDAFNEIEAGLDVLKTITNFYIPLQSKLEKICIEIETEKNKAIKSNKFINETKINIKSAMNQLTNAIATATSSHPSPAKVVDVRRVADGGSISGTDLEIIKDVISNSSEMMRAEQFANEAETYARRAKLTANEFAETMKSYTSAAEKLKRQAEAAKERESALDAHDELMKKGHEKIDTSLKQMNEVLAAVNVARTEVKDKIVSMETDVYSAVKKKLTDDLVKETNDALIANTKTTVTNIVKGANEKLNELMGKDTLKKRIESTLKAEKLDLQSLAKQAILDEAFRTGLEKETKEKAKMVLNDSSFTKELKEEAKSKALGALEEMSFKGGIKKITETSVKKILSSDEFKTDVKNATVNVLDDLAKAEVVNVFDGYKGTLKSKTEREIDQIITKTNINESVKKKLDNDVKLLLNDETLKIKISALAKTTADEWLNRNMDKAIDTFSASEGFSNKISAAITRVWKNRSSGLRLKFIELLNDTTKEADVIKEVKHKISSLINTESRDFGANLERARTEINVTYERLNEFFHFESLKVDQFVATINPGYLYLKRDTKAVSDGVQDVSTHLTGLFRRCIKEHKIAMIEPGVYMVASEVNISGNIDEGNADLTVIGCGRLVQFTCEAFRTTGDPSVMFKFSNLNKIKIENIKFLTSADRSTKSKDPVKSNPAANVDFVSVTRCREGSFVDLNFKGGNVALTNFSNAIGKFSYENCRAQYAKVAFKLGSHNEIDMSKCTATLCNVGFDLDKVANGQFVGCKAVSCDTGLVLNLSISSKLFNCHFLANRTTAFKISKCKAIGVVNASLESGEVSKTGDVIIEQSKYCFVDGLLKLDDSSMNVNLKKIAQSKLRVIGELSKVGFNLIDCTGTNLTLNPISEYGFIDIVSCRSTKWSNESNFTQGETSDIKNKSKLNSSKTRETIFVPVEGDDNGLGKSFYEWFESADKDVGRADATGTRRKREVEEDQGCDYEPNLKKTR